MQEVNFSSHAYCKMMLHAAKYPQCAVNGVLLASNDQNDGRSQSVAYVDAIPLFHLCLNVSPMAEIALSQIESWASADGLTIAGYYSANENLYDTSIDKPANKIADKINEKFRSSNLVVIDNRLVTLSHSDPAIKTFHNIDGKWRLLDKSKVQIDDSVLVKTSELMLQKAYYDLVDFDNHLDNISLDWKNVNLNDQIDDVDV
ncbi:hypothetical protein V9T40_014631 [Parthenolecanium corni]|uniref:MPN domain-containing protein n=1 Tax=Parthenolecanium corni TaxID=536013 RepID=A0AAN9XYG3_9HEMI